MRKWALLLAIGLAASTVGAAPEGKAVSSVAGVRALGNRGAARHLPVDLQATVTYYRWYEKTLFVQEEGVGVYVWATTDLPLKPGDLVRVRGTTQDSFNPIVISSDIALLGHGEPPKPVPATWTSLIRGDDDCLWVTARGRVEVAEMGFSSGRVVTHLLLGMDGGIAEVLVDNDDPANLKGLLDAQIEVTAVGGETFDGKMQQTGVQFHLPSFANLRVLKRSAIDPWSIPVTPMDKVLGGYNVAENTPRVRVEGTLTYYRQTAMAVLQDGAESIRVLTSQADRLKLGDRVEAIGVPIAQDGLLTLKMGVIRSVGAGSAVAPQPVSWDDLSSGKYAFNLVTIDGAALSQVRESGRDVYVFSTADQHLFSASLAHSFSYTWPPRELPTPIRRFQPGTKVRVTGVAMQETGDPYNGPIAFSILLDSVDDISTVAGPPWLSVRHLIEVVGLLLLVVIVVSVRAWLVERGTWRKIASMAYLEQRRAKILELINNSHPLAETLRQITEMVSASLAGAPCWCQVVDGARIGNCPADLAARSFRVVEHTIPSRSGAPLGAIFAAFDTHAKPQRDRHSALGLAAGLATLAIETSRLYTDLVHRSEFDLLTDVPNRFSLEKFMDGQIEAAHQSARIFGLLFVDLDEFKQVNDVYGHQVGDQYLQETARRMKHQLRPGDMLARLGGDEFAALAPHVRSRAEVEEIALRLEGCFAEPFLLHGHFVQGTASIGIAVYPEDGASGDSLLTAADSAMYVAKNLRRSLSPSHREAQA